jgi:uncharacterized coiled-coil DUF342 family protein
LVLGYVSWRNGKAIKEAVLEIAKMIDNAHRETREMFERMDERAEERHREVLERQEKMDELAEERHREVLQILAKIGTT